uniref:Uncharacterized protein n=1 Tax=Brassica campestris TaxID=3711 RepID=A0A3P5YTN3_BRACM|nr:unnamed protein product [Brassica rapa]
MHDIRIFQAIQKIPRSSLIPLNHPGSRKIRFFTWSQNSTKGSTASF